MRLKIRIILGLLFSTVFLTACGAFYFEGVHGTGKAYENEKGELILNCNKQAMYDEEIFNFWEKNNLPKGTTEFVCKNGKAYLPNQVPQN